MHGYCVKALSRQVLAATKCTKMNTREGVVHTSLSQDKYTPSNCNRPQTVCVKVEGGGGFPHRIVFPKKSPQFFFEGSEKITHKSQNFWQFFGETIVVRRLHLSSHRTTLTAATSGSSSPKHSTIFIFMHYFWKKDTMYVVRVDFVSGTTLEIASQIFSNSSVSIGLTVCAIFYLFCNVTHSSPFNCLFNVWSKGCLGTCTPSARERKRQASSIHLTGYRCC